MGLCEAPDCGYYWKDEDDDFPRCHWEVGGFPAPCEYDDNEEDM